jgi:hypothetical protein
MRKHLCLIAVLCGIGIGIGAPFAEADVLIRMNETSVKGTFKGGTDAAVMFETGGQVQQVPAGDVLCILFSPRPGGPETGPAGAPAGAGSMTLLRRNGGVLKGTFKGGTDAALLFDVAGQVEQVNLTDVLLVMNERPAAAAPAVLAAGTAPAGTKLMITLTQDVTTATHAKGAVVEGALAAPVTLNGSVLIPEGTKAFGTVLESRGGKVVGGAYITIAFTSLLIGTTTVPIQTNEVGAEAGRGATAKKVGAGALIGAAAGDAGAGAAVGGAVALLTSGGKHIRIPKGTKAEVTLKQDVKIGG